MIKVECRDENVGFILQRRDDVDLKYLRSEVISRVQARVQNGVEERPRPDE